MSTKRIRLHRRAAHFPLGCGGELYAGDCRIVLATTLAEASIDAVVTDPPYHLTTGAGTRGFMNQAWDGGGVAFDPALWKLVHRVTKPGAHVLAFGGTRTYHHLVAAIEAAGFAIRDCVLWLYGTGFPKSRNVSIDIDKMNGAEREVLERRTFGASSLMRALTANSNNTAFSPGERHHHNRTRPASPEAQRWDGWGTALKPACELIVLARKPLSERNTATNVLRHGVGALNIDGCRVGDKPMQVTASDGTFVSNNIAMTGHNTGRLSLGVKTGRWPANLIHDGSAEVVASFGDSDTAARFYYQAKADLGDRFAFKHPTVKPVDLMAYLVRLITPPGGVVLDPFAGTGTTGEAAFREGKRAVLIEQDKHYRRYIHDRYAIMKGGGYARRLAIAKARINRAGGESPGLFKEEEIDGSGHARTRP